MTDAKRDSNSVTTALGLSSTNGTTVLPLYADPTTHAMKVSNGTTGSDLGSSEKRDTNYEVVLFAVSSTDGKTLVPVYIAAANNGLLIQST